MYSLKPGQSPKTTQRNVVSRCPLTAPLTIGAGLITTPSGRFRQRSDTVAAPLILELVHPEWDSSSFSYRRHEMLK
ncbi:hypothetical protein PFLUV_G00071280 [Perca fluviatilis]|uniref:Uncharacterized protein n=1 Tax=Perca fluviatilis TaxID=8168 RepID=A0A6A5F6U9_PERFL|nr:hypothetical protein PFLUV_G00071280 [Perca fluviatilis]